MKPLLLLVIWLSSLALSSPIQDEEDQLFHKFGSTGHTNLFLNPPFVSRRPEETDEGMGDEQVDTNPHSNHKSKKKNSVKAGVMRLKDSHVGISKRESVTISPEFEFLSEHLENLSEIFNVFFAKLQHFDESSNLMAIQDRFVQALGELFEAISSRCASLTPVDSNSNYEEFFQRARTGLESLLQTASDVPENEKFKQFLMDFSKSVEYFFQTLEEVVAIQEDTSSSAKEGVLRQFTEALSNLHHVLNEQTQIRDELKPDSLPGFGQGNLANRGFVGSKPEEENDLLKFSTYLIDFYQALDRIAKEKPSMEDTNALKSYSDALTLLVESSKKMIDHTMNASFEFDFPFPNVDISLIYSLENELAAIKAPDNVGEVPIKVKETLEHNFALALQDFMEVFDFVSERSFLNFLNYEQQLFQSISEHIHDLVRSFVPLIRYQNRPKSLQNAPEKQNLTSGPETVDDFVKVFEEAQQENSTLENSQSKASNRFIKNPFYDQYFFSMSDSTEPVVDDYDQNTDRQFVQDELDVTAKDPMQEVQKETGSEAESRLKEVAELSHNTEAKIVECKCSQDQVTNESGITN